MHRAVSAASVVLLGVLAGCGSAGVRAAADLPGTDPTSVPASSTPSAGESPGIEPVPTMPDSPRRLMRCLHSSTVPVESVPAPTQADPGAEIDPRFWRPFYVECHPAVGLQEVPPEVNREPGVQPLD